MKGDVVCGRLKNDNTFCERPRGFGIRQGEDGFAELAARACCRVCEREQSTRAVTTIPWRMRSLRIQPVRVIADDPISVLYDVGRGFSLLLQRARKESQWAAVREAA